MKDSEKADDSPAALARRLDGQVLRIPDLRPLFSHWPTQINVNKDRLEVEVIEILRQWVFQHEERPKLSIDGHWPLTADDDRKVKSEKAANIVQEADVVTLAARFWPRAALDKIRFLTQMVIWASIIEDYVEKLPADTDFAKKFRADAKSCWTEILGLGGSDSPRDNVHPLIQGLEPFGKQINAVFDTQRRKIVLEHLLMYIEGNKQEATWRDGDRLPTYRQRQENRLESSGTSSFIALSEFAHGKLMPLEVVTSQTWKSLLNTANRINNMTNDLLSLKREFHDGSVLNAVIIKTHELGELNGAVEHVVNEIKLLIGTFDTEAELLLETAGNDPEARKCVKGVVDVMRSFNTGNLEWSLQSARYGLPEHTRDDGSIEVVLKWGKPM